MDRFACLRVRRLDPTGSIEFRRANWAAGAWRHADAPRGVGREEARAELVAPADSCAPGAGAGELERRRERQERSGGAGAQHLTAKPLGEPRSLSGIDLRRHPVGYECSGSQTFGLIHSSPKADEDGPLISTVHDLTVLSVTTDRNFRFRLIRALNSPGTRYPHAGQSPPSTLVCGSPSSLKCSVLRQASIADLSRSGTSAVDP